MTRTTLYGTLTQDEELNENEKAMLYIKECAELVGFEVIEDKTAFSINFIAKIMKRLRKEPKTGHWECNELFYEGESRGAIIRCNKCGNEFKVSPKVFENLYSNERFCNHCGAKMESE